MNPTPICLKCEQSPYTHAMLGQWLACSWDGRKVTQRADFGPDSAIIIEGVWLSAGKAVPAKLAKAAKDRREEKMRRDHMRLVT